MQFKYLSEFPLEHLFTGQRGTGGWGGGCGTDFLRYREGCTGLPLTLRPRASTGQALSRLRADDFFYQVLEKIQSLPWA